MPIFLEQVVPRELPSSAAATAVKPRLPVSELISFGPDVAKNIKTKLTRKMGVGCVAHISGDGTTFRQVVAVPVVSINLSNQLVRPLKGHLLNLLIERANGQVITLCFLDRQPNWLDLPQFFGMLEEALPDRLDTARGITHIEESIAKSVGFTVSLSEVTLDGAGSCFYKNAVAALGAVIVADTISAPEDTSCDIKLIHSEVNRVLTKQLHEATSSFVLKLDSRIVAAIVRSGEILTTERYNRYRCLGPAKRDRRLQAAEAFPLLGDILIDKQRLSALVRRTVDRKQPLIPAISKTFQVSHEVVRWMIGKDINLVGRGWSGRVAELTKLLGNVCPEHRPRSAEDWSAFSDACYAIEQLEARCQGSPFVERVSATASLMRDVARRGWQTTRNRLNSMGTSMSDLADMSDVIDEIVQVLADHVGEGGVLSDLLHDELLPPVKALYFSVGIFRQLQASMRWHQLMLEPDIQTPSPIAHAAPSLHSWPAPFDGLLDVNGLIAVCLINPTQLRDEGVRMQHCVRNYIDHCLYYGSTIISIRHQDGTRLSTAELTLAVSQTDVLRFEVRQHRGYKNTEAPTDAVDALAKLLTVVNGRELLPRLQYMHTALKHRKAIRRDRPSTISDQQRIDRLKQSLKLHVGYEHFYDIALQMAK